MSYYDDPLTSLNANLASQKSILVDYKYSYKRIVNTIITTPPEELSEELLTQQLNLIISIRQQKELINSLESNLQQVTESLNTVVPAAEPIPVDLSNNEVVPPLIVQEVPPLVDLSNNEVVPPLIVQEVPPLVDLSNNEVVPPLIVQEVPPLVDLSNNVV